MRKILLLLSVLAFTNTAFVQTQAAQQIERQKMIAKIEKKIEDGVILEFLRKTNKKIKKSIKNNQPLLSIQYKSFASSLEIWMKYRWFIADTGLSKKWLKKIRALLLYMSKTQGYVEAARFNGETKTEKYKKAIEYFDLAYERLGKLMKKPVKAPDRVIQDEKVKKDIWQRAMRKKYNIKKDSWYDF